MINYIKKVETANQVFITKARDNPQAIYAPKLIHTSTFTVESYLSVGKQNFDIELLKPLLTRLDITDLAQPIAELEHERMLLVHYLAFISEQAPNVYLEFDTIEYSEQFINNLFVILSTYDNNNREITLITNNEAILERVRIQATTEEKEFNDQTFVSKVSAIDLIRNFIGGKPLVMASLIFGLLIISMTTNIDAHLIENYSGYISLPRNIIAIHNTSTSCDFNNYSYDIENCSESQAITYSQLQQLLAQEGVETIYFDNKYNIKQLDKKIANGEPAVASVPQSTIDVNNHLSAIPCTNPELTVEAVTCEEYNPETSLISEASLNDDMQLVNNIVNDPRSSPDYIFIKTSETRELSKYLANRYPSINIMNNRSVENYIQKLNRKLIVTVLGSGTLISLAIEFSLFYILLYFGMSLRGLKYFYGYKTRRPYYTTKLYFLTQIAYFGTMMILGSLITLNITGSMTGYYISVYFGLINILFWVYLAMNLGGRFKTEDQQLFIEIKAHELKLKQDKTKK